MLGMESGCEGSEHERMVAEKRALGIMDHDVIGIWRGINPLTRYLNDASLLANVYFAVMGMILRFEANLHGLRHTRACATAVCFRSASGRSRFSSAPRWGPAFRPNPAGSLQAAEALKLLLGIGYPRSCRLSFSTH